MINIQRFTVNFIEENCYVLSDDTHEAVIVDCGANAAAEQDAIRTYIESHALKPRHLLCTHGHFDHIFGAQFVADTYGLLPELSTAERTTYEQAAEQMKLFLHRSLPLALPAIGRTFSESDEICFGTHRLSIIATPGHTPGGVCFYCAEEKILLSGDSLFRYSIGRCDLPGGSEQSLIAALRERVLTLPDDVRVFPGHGAATTIGEERTANPYLF